MHIPFGELIVHMCIVVILSCVDLLLLLLYCYHYCLDFQSFDFESTWIDIYISFKFHFSLMFLRQYTVHSSRQFNTVGLPQKFSRQVALHCAGEHNIVQTLIRRRCTNIKRNCITFDSFLPVIRHHEDNGNVKL